MALVDKQLDTARKDLARHHVNIQEYLYRGEYHGVWDFSVECQNARDVIRALTILRKEIEDMPDA